jgi:predicted CXXCH cytochrome family protein
MKKFIVLTAVLVLMASSSFALIENSGHDFTGQAWTNDICAPCHTPHNSISGSGPLWAHTSSVQTFDLYDATVSSTFDGTTAQPSGISLACLSCHDGQTNVDGFIGSSNGLTGTTALGAVAANLGTDLTNDHPIGFDYDAALVGTDGGLNAPVSVNEVTAGGMPLFGGTGSLECATCHDVHNGAAAGYASLLRADPAGSVICLTCHNK